MNNNTSLLVEASWVYERLNDPHILVVDTRGSSEFEAGHIPGATNLPSGDLFDSESVGSDLLSVPEIEQEISEAGIDNTTHLVLYDESGLVPSARIFWVLENLGRTHMSLLDRGLPGWIAQNMPLEKGPPLPKRAEFRATREDAALATREQVLAAIDNPDSVIIDTRTADEYHGRNAAHARNGHIPGAVNVDWQEHITDLFDPALLSIPELQTRYKQVGASRDKHVITYCRTASRSSHTYFVLRLLGYEHVRNYSGSWMEWNVDESLPIE